MLGHLWKFFVTICGLAFVASALLFLLRFTGPNIGLCKTRGSGKSLKTRCMGLLEFTGDDLVSIFRVRQVSDVKFYER